MASHASSPGHETTSPFDPLILSALSHCDIGNNTFPDKPVEELPALYEDVVVVENTIPSPIIPSLGYGVRMEQSHNCVVATTHGLEAGEHSPWHVQGHVPPPPLEDMNRRRTVDVVRDESMGICLRTRTSAPPAVDLALIGSSSPSPLFPSSPLLTRSPAHSVDSDGSLPDRGKHSVLGDLKPLESLTFDDLPRLKRNDIRAYLQSRGIPCKCLKEQLLQQLKLLLISIHKGDDSFVIPPQIVEACERASPRASPVELNSPCMECSNMAKRGCPFQRCRACCFRLGKPVLCPAHDKEALREGKKLPRRKSTTTLRALPWRERLTPPLGGTGTVRRTSSFPLLQNQLATPPDPMDQFSGGSQETSHANVEVSCTVSADERFGHIAMSLFDHVSPPMDLVELELGEEPLNPRPLYPQAGVDIPQGNVLPCDGNSGHTETQEFATFSPPPPSYL